MIWLIDNQLKQLSGQISIEKQGMGRKEKGKEKRYVLIQQSVTARKKMEPYVVGGCLFVPGFLALK